MKQFRITAWVLAALVFLPAASVWEGAAAVAPNGELPDSGYYAATNSFPRNTVVELTNLETGKTVQVIVALGLDSPGLLATVSRDAAAAIGLQSRSIGRIRMTQPRDPIAFSRFIDGLGSSGDPDFDPQARVQADSPAAEAASGGETPAGETPTAETSALAETPAGGDEAPEAAVAETPRPAAETPLWAGETGEEKAAEAAEENAVAAEIPAENAGAEDAGTALAETPETGPVIAEFLPTEIPAETPVEVPLETPAAPDWEGAELVLVPAEERPPAGPDPAEFHEPAPPEISFSELPRETYPERAMDSRFFVDPIENIEPAPEISFPPGGESFARETLTPPPVFSAPLIGRLEQGKYYVQLGAYSKAELVEAELQRIGRAYPVAVQNGGSSERPLYRILLGPVNLGESGAILQRFKGSGYNDAFVRQGS